jgi:anti-sigma-K factor RskA
MSETRGMTVARFHSLVDAYGAAPQRWPAAERAAAEALLAGSGEARLKLAAAQGLDAALDALSAPPPSARLVARLEGLSRPAASPERRRRRFALPAMAAWRPAAYAATCLAGVMVGYLAMPGAPLLRTAPEIVDMAVLDGPSATIAAQMFGGAR